MKIFAVCLVCCLPFCAMAQYKLPEKIKSAFATLISYRPAVHTDFQLRYSKMTKYRGHHRKRVRKKTDMRFSFDVAFDNDKLGKRQRRL